MDIGWWLLFGSLYLFSIVVCFQKGKPGFGALGLVGFIPFLTPVLAWFPVIGAVRLAKPNSSWALRRYGPGSMSAATNRFPDATVASLPASTPPNLSWGDQPSVPGPVESQTVMTEQQRRSVISEFLSSAQKAGVIDNHAHVKLVRFLQPDEQPQAPPIPAPKPAAPTVRAAEPPPISPPVPPKPRPPQPTPPPPPQPAPKPRPMKPAEPGVLATKATETWKALASDVAVHGFAYLGVLLTFVGVLGFLLFAFVDVPDAAQPFVELFIALVFFGWAWVLRRQKATRIANGMELIGGMILPLILFAGLVDNAPFPPDFQDGALVAALTITTVLLAVVYAWISKRNPESTLRFLIGPLLWLGAMTLGFAFKTDEVLTSDAITRLVSAQPAMASAAIALTLAACHWRPNHRLAAPTVTAALYGLPVTYLLTVSLSVGEEWAHPVPAVLLGVSTIASAELLGAWFDKRPLVTSLRPLLIAGVVAPLVPLWGLGWAGLTATLLYIALFELARRAESRDVVVLWFSGVGVAAGLAMSLAEPWAALIAFTVGTVWVHVRRLDPDSPYETRTGFLVVAALLPIGIGYGLYQLTGPGVAWLTMSAVLTAATLAVRWRKTDDPFWAYWPTAASWMVAAAALSAWNANVATTWQAVATIGLAALAVGLGRRWAVLRLWMGVVLGSIGLSVFLDGQDIPTSQRTLVWALVGLSLVLLATVWRRRPAGHLAAIGHLIGLVALIALPSGDQGVIVQSAWTLAWIASVISAERGDDGLSALLERVATPGEGPPDGRLTSAMRWGAPLIMVASVPPALLSAAKLWGEFAAHRSWTGVTLGAIAVIYSLSARVYRDRKPLSQALALGAIVSSIIGAAVAAPNSWPTIIAAGSIIAVAATLTGDLRKPGFIWFAWIMSVVMTLLLAEQAGVATNRLQLVGLVAGGVMLLGGLIYDDVRSGRRCPGEGLRVMWLRHPVLLGALIVPLSLGPTFALEPETYGWWSLGAAALYFIVAALLRVGSVTAPGCGLLTVGLVALSPWSLIDQPWRFVVIAAPLIAISWAADRFQSDESSSDGWLRWDMAPLVVAHLIGVIALVIAVGNETLLPSAGAFGALSIAIGLWRRQRAWIEAGNFMILVAANAAGIGWLALALAATAVRGAVSTVFSRDESRTSYQLIGVTSAGLAWLAFVRWQDLTSTDAANYSVILFASLALLMAVLSRLWRLKRDTVLSWGVLAVAGMIVAVGAALGAQGDGVQGPWFAIGFVILAAALELATGFLGTPLKLASVITTGIAWVALAAGLDWERADIVTSTAVAFGGFGLVVAILARFGVLERSDGQRWIALATAGVTFAALTSLDTTTTYIDGPWLAIGIVLLALAFESAADSLGDPLRVLSVVASGFAWVALAAGLGWERTDIVTYSAVIFGGLGLVVAILARSGLLQRSDGRRWIALATAGVALAALTSLDTTTTYIDGPWLAVGFVLLAIGFELAAWSLGTPLKLASVVTTGFAWIAMLGGLEPTRADIISDSAVIFGGLGLVLAILLRLKYLRGPDAQRWGALAVVGVAVAIFVAIFSGSSHVAGPALAIGILLLAAAFELAARDLEQNLRYLTVVSFGAAWIALAVGLDWDTNTVAIATMIVFGLLLTGTVEVRRIIPIGPTTDVETPEASHPSAGVARAWAGLGAVGVLGAIVNAAAMTDLAASLYWIASGLGVLAIGMARGAGSLSLPWLRHTSMVTGLAAITYLARAVEMKDSGLALSVIGVSVVATATTLFMWKRRPDSVWHGPLILLGVAANLEAAVFAFNALPATELVVVVLFSMGIQAVAVGITVDEPGLLAIGPPMIGVAFIMMISESVSGTTQWYTIPIALVLLSEVEILRKARKASGGNVSGTDVIVLEWAGVALMSAPALVEMFTTALAFGLVAFGISALLLIWAILTRVRRRAVAAASLAVGTAVLILFAAAAGGAPDSAFFWIVAVGIGFAVSLVAALVEAYRSQKGNVMLRVDQLMEGWS